MKRLFTASAIVLSLLIISCNNQSESGGMSEAAKKNLAAMNGVGKCFETKDFSNVGDFVAADVVDHAGEHGDINGLDSLKAEFNRWSTTVENDKGEVITEFANDEYAAQWMHFTGTSKIDQMGWKAGEKYDMKALELARCKDGKIVEHWTFMTPQEMTEMMAKMGMQMPMQMPTSTDTAPAN